MAYFLTTSRITLTGLLPVLLLSSIWNARGERGDGWGWQSEMHTEEHLSASPENPTVSIRDGLLKGSFSETIGKRRIASFRSVPYGRPPIGPLRFQSPRLPNAWTGIRDATVETPRCIQIDFMTKDRIIRGQEDCLYLEVHTPHNLVIPEGTTTSQLFPVMVYIHGGSFACGAAAIYGPHYLLDENVVLVTINYRLGPFGFLSTGNSAAYGNAGLKDQVLALKWVQENIAQFGGDPNSVTIVGQSAGGGSVNHHIVSPASRDLFHRVISHSGSSLCWWAITDNAPEIAVRAGSLFGCYGHSSQDLVSCLQTVPAQELVTAHFNLSDWNNFPIVVFGPVIEAPNPGAFLVDHPTETYRKGQAAHVPWINGLDRYEMSWLLADFLQFPDAVAELNRDWDRFGAIFLAVGNSTNARSRSGIATKIRDFYLGRGNTEIGYSTRYEVAKMAGDRYFLKCGLDGMYLHAKYTGEEVYGFEFSFEGKYSIVQLYGQKAEEWGVAHLDDIIYLLNSTEFYGEIQRNGDPEERKMSEIMTSTWANFATFGKPYVGHSKALIQNELWKPIQVLQDRHDSKAVDMPNFQFLDLNLAPKMIRNPYVERYNFWNNIQHLID